MCNSIISQAVKAERRESKLKPKFFEIKDGQEFGKSGDDKKIRKEKK